MWKRFVAMGDSVTEGIGDEVKGIPCVSWADHLAKEWKEANQEFRYTNTALRGQTAAEIRQTQLEQCLALQPDLVSVMAGGNDVLTGKWNAALFEQEFVEMLSALTKTGATVISSTVPDFPRFAKLPPSQAEHLRGQLQELNQLIRKICAHHGVPFAELWHAPFTMNVSTWSRDGIHPNSIGYQELANALKEVLMLAKNRTI